MTFNKTKATSKISQIHEPEPNRTEAFLLKQVLRFNLTSIKFEYSVFNDAYEVLLEESFYGVYTKLI
jgi:hypothetical protein